MGIVVMDYPSTPLNSLSPSSKAQHIKELIHAKSWRIAGETNCLE
jgi:hypothetical protein